MSLRVRSAPSCANGPGAGTQHPGPPVPPEVDLRGLDYMPLFGNHLFGSDFNAGATDAEWRAAITLWWKAWNQVPAGSLPHDDAALCRLADLGRDVKTWKRLRERALHGFILCDDGRLYHPFLCQQALIAWEKRVKDRERKARSRALLSVKSHGQDGGGLRDISDVSQEPEQGQDADVLADVKGHDVTGRDSSDGGTTPHQDGVDVLGYQPTDAGIICRALRVAGIHNTNPGHPGLRVLLDAGATENEFLGAVNAARDKSDPFAYVLVVVERQRMRAAETAKGLHLGPMPMNRKNRQLQTAGFMTGSVDTTINSEVIDADVTAPRKLG